MTLLWQGGCTSWPTEVPSNPYHSVILWQKFWWRTVNLQPVYHKKWTNIQTTFVITVNVLCVSSQVFPSSELQFLQECKYTVRVFMASVASCFGKFERTLKISDALMWLLWIWGHLLGCTVHAGLWATGVWLLHVCTEVLWAEISPTWLWIEARD